MVEMEVVVESLTDKQARVLDFIRERIGRDGCPPTVREIAKRFRFASTSTARAHLNALEKKGYIERHFHASRGIRLTAEAQEQSGLPVVGRVAAGTPILAEENIEDFLPLDRLYPADGSCFCLKVQGDSMKDAGILDDDYVVVRQKSDFENGKIGVAVLDGEATVKRLRRRGRHVKLIPANEAYKPQLVDTKKVEFRYAGEVIGVHRMLKQ